MKVFVIFLVLMFLPIIIPTSFAQQIPDCTFGSTMTPLSEKFAKDLAVKEFLKQYPNATKSILDNDSDPKQLVLHAVTGAVKETLELHFHIDEKGCYIPSEYHYKYNDGEIDVIVINTIGNFTEIMNLIKSDNITIDSLYPDDCKIVNLEHDISAGKVYGICEKENSVIALIDASSDAMFQVDIPIEMVYSLPSTNCIPTGDFSVVDNRGSPIYDITESDIGNSVRVELAEGFHRIQIIGSIILPSPSPVQYCGVVEGFDKPYLPPRNQIDNGMKQTYVKCNEGLVLLQKYDGSPACVTESTKTKLIERGWAKDDNMIPTFDYVIEKDGVTYGSQYQISGGIVDEIFYDKYFNSLTISLHDSEKGFLQIVIQTGLLHSLEQMPFTYFVIVDGEEIVFEQLSPIIVKIPFEKGTKQIEIIGTPQILENENTTKTTEVQLPTEELIVEKIGDTPRASDTMRVGIPFLAIDPRSNTPDKYHEVKAENYTWIQRLLTDGETIVNVKELDEYFSIVDTDNNPQFGVTMNDGTIEYFTIDFYEVQNFDLDRHYIKVYPLYDQPTKNLRTLDQESSSWMTDLSKNRFNWVLVDDATYNKYVGQTLDGKQFNILTAKGDFENVELRYAGANSEVKPNLHLLYDEEIEN